MKRFKFKNTRGSVMLIAMLVATIGTFTIGRLYKHVNFTSHLLEKEIASIQAMNLAENALLLRKNVIEASNANGGYQLSISDITNLESQIRIAMQTVSSINFGGTLDFDSQITTPMSSILTPGSGIEFPGFNAVQTTYASFTHDATSGGFKQSMARKVGLSMNIKLIPAFSILALYDQDMEIAEAWENCAMFGRLHCNGDVFLSARRPDWDPLYFHSPVNTPALSAVGKVYRRGRNGITPEWISDNAGYQANAIRFRTYNTGPWNSLFGTNGLYNTQSTVNVVPFTRELTNEYALARDRRFPDPEKYYIRSDVMDGGTLDAIVAADNSVRDNSDNYLSPPVALKPYQYIEDIQYYDIWDTNLQVDWQQDRAISNYSQDTENRVKEQALSAKAAIVIRDGVAYTRDTPGGSLSLVVPTGAGTSTAGYYPSNSHSQKRRYSDLRWFGWFGMYNGVNPSPGNPARWHFPVRSVTFIDSDDTPGNGVNGNGASWNGSAANLFPNPTVAFTYDSSTVMDPEADAFSGAPSSVHFIDTTRNMHEVYADITAPNFRNQGGTSYNYSTWPTEAFHPNHGNADLLRAQYVRLKHEVRKMHNAHHIYTSLHDDNMMLNLDGTSPGLNTVPNGIWGNGTTNAPASGVDFNGNANRFSAFWDDDNNAATPKVELFPFNHVSVKQTGNAMGSFGIFKSTLPLSDRTIGMPPTQAEMTTLQGYTYTNARTPSTSSNELLWYWRLNNYPETLKRITTGSNQNQNTPAYVNYFRYYGGENGGYYGNDNLCMFNEREKKFNVFTELDLSELTQECLIFNGIESSILPPATAATLSEGSTDELENIIYVVNSSIGNNFYGSRVHTGAVRIKRGRTFWTRLSIATPNPVFIWGDLNFPGFRHQFTTFNSFNYTVPTDFHGTSRTKQPFSIYADTINALPNNWLNGNGNQFLGGLRHSGGDINFSTPVNGDMQTRTRIMFDSSLWWEDDGHRILGKANKQTNSDLFGDHQNGTLEDYINYTWLIFDNPDGSDSGSPAPFIRTTLPFMNGSAAPGMNREHQTPMAQLIPIGINSALFFGQVLSQPPVWFDQAQIDGISGAKPSGVSDLEWYIDKIPSDQRRPLDSSQLSVLYNGNASGNAGNNNGNLTLTNDDSSTQTININSGYYNLQFPTSGGPDNRFERVKGYFGGGGLNNSIRLHQYYYHNLTNENELGMYVNGAFVCLFSSRQDKQLYSSYLLSEQAHQQYFRFDPDLQQAENLPPGTPMMVQAAGGDFFQIEGSKYR